MLIVVRRRIILYMITIPANLQLLSTIRMTKLSVKTKTPITLSSTSQRMNMLRVTVRLETVLHLIIHILNTATLMNTTTCSIVTLKDMTTQTTTIHMGTLTLTTTILMSTVTQTIIIHMSTITQAMPTGTAMLTDTLIPMLRQTGKVC